MDQFIIENYSALEMAASLFGLIYVVLEVLQKNCMWYLWIITSVFFCILYYHSNVYAYMGLQFYYIVLGVYGFIQWKRNKDRVSSGEDVLVVVPMSRRVLMATSSLAAVVFMGLAFILRYTADPNPWLDSFCAVISMLASYWLSRQYLENWYLWIVCNIASFGLSLSIGQYFVAVYFLVLIGMALWGLCHWKRKFAE